jgi:hypothetical protein
MKNPKTRSTLLLGLLLMAAAAAAGLTARPALAQICTDPATGQVIPCPREKKTKIPTPVPPTRTPTPTATPAGIPLTGGDGGGAAPAVVGTPAVQLRAFATGSFLIGLLILVLFLGGVFGPKGGLFKRYGVFGHTGGANTSGLSEVAGNDQGIGMDRPKAYLARNDGRVQQVSQHNEQTGTTMHESGHDLDADHDGLNQTWEEGGNIDMNTDGTNTAEQGDTSGSTRKPPDGG